MRSIALLSLILATLVGCSGLTDTGGGALPSGVVDPATYNSPAGARGMYHRTVLQFERAFVDALLTGGLLTDELRGSDERDRRELPEGRTNASDATYGALQLVRTYQVQAAGALAKYDTADTRALRGHTFALAGYAEVLLADLYCSGVPLSRLQFEGDYAYDPGSSTAQIYRHAITLFDSALALAAGNDTVSFLARVGRGRALLALDSAAAAARAVAGVPDQYQYAFPVAWVSYDSYDGPWVGSMLLAASVADREGGVGLPFVSGGDPRTRVAEFDVFTPSGVFAHYRAPAKYGTPLQDSVFTYYYSMTSPVVVASGVEARLVEAEAALRAGNVSGWAAKLNALRATAISPAIPPLPADSTMGASAALQVDVMFAERAKWLFVDGHRQGDLRRLLKQYPQIYQSQASVYPSGPYAPLVDVPIGGLQFYGADVTAPVPQSERPNPYFKGCFSRLP